MSCNPTNCFFTTYNASRDGSISEQEKLRTLVRHLSLEGQDLEAHNVRTSMIESWAGSDDFLIAAIQVCMLKREKPWSAAPDTEDLLVKMLGECRSLQLQDLRAMDQQPNPILEDAFLYQLIVAAALQSGNRALVREMVTNSEPAPGHEVLFGCEDPTYNHHHSFGEGYVCGSGALKGQADNGCEVWAAMIRAGWASPRQYMQTWAASTAATAAGKELFSALADRGVSFTLWCLLPALEQSRYETLEHALGLYQPQSGDECFQVLTYAAHIKEGGVRFFELLAQHGIKDYNWEPPRIGKPGMPMYREDPVPYRSVLHVAAEQAEPDVVEWLIQHGALGNRKDFFAMTPCGLARSMGRSDVVAVFEKYQMGV